MVVPAPPIDQVFRAPRSQAQQRIFAPTISVQDNPTPLNFKKVAVEVSDGIVKDGGILAAFTQTIISYKIRTAPLGYEVRRKDTEFAFLRKILNR